MSTPWYARWMDDPRTEELGLPLLHHAAELVAMGGLDDESARATLLDAVIDSLVAQQRGSTRLPAPESVAVLAAAGVAPEILSTDVDAYRPLIVTDGWLYHQRTLHYERTLAARLGERLAAEPQAWAGLDDALAEVVASPAVRPDGTPVALSDEQIAAVHRAASRPLCVVTGGPGTGKTSIVVSLLRTLVRCGIDPARIALAAPTGKAANRLGESIDQQLRALSAPAPADAALSDAALAPMTLHRLLKYSGNTGRFRRDAHDPIDADWIVVDEASMIDLVLMERLVRCVAPGTRLVLLGDVEQLPSVETGTVLRDLIPAADAPHVVRLQQSFRMDPRDPAGRAILGLAQTVRDGDLPALDAALAEEAVGFEDVAPELMRGRVLDFVDDWFETRVVAMEDFRNLTLQPYRLDDGEFGEAAQADIDRLFRHFDRFRILCLTRVFATGADALNEAFHLRMARLGGVEGVPEFLAGEPVLMLHNDYERGLFNGDQGVILRIDTGDDARLGAVFPGADGYRAHHLSGLGGQLAHAWAMTVHKSQGSEFDEVAVVLPADDIPLLSRELLYTAITRARRRVALLGPRSLLRVGAQRTVDRWSGLSSRLFP